MPTVWKACSHWNYLFQECEYGIEECKNKECPKFETTDQMLNRVLPLDEEVK